MAKLSEATHIPYLPDEFTDLSEVNEYLDDLSKYLRYELETIKHNFNGWIELINQRVALVTVNDTGAANTDFTVFHGLGTIPRYYIWNIDRNGVVYKGSASWTTMDIFLRCSVANALVDLIIIP